MQATGSCDMQVRVKIGESGSSGDGSLASIKICQLSIMGMD